jgi:hypothetical protein
MLFLATDSQIRGWPVICESAVKLFFVYQNNSQ